MKTSPNVLTDILQSRASRAEAIEFEIEKGEKFMNRANQQELAICLEIFYHPINSVTSGLAPANV